MFSIAELKEYLASPKNANKDEKLSRKEFEGWLRDYTETLRQSIKANEVLPLESQAERVAKASSDFKFFFETYLPHYKNANACEGKASASPHAGDSPCAPSGGDCVFHNDLFGIFTEIANKNPSEAQGGALRRAPSAPNVCSDGAALPFQANETGVPHKALALRGGKYAIAAPRGYGKTTLVSVAFPLWCALYGRKHFIIEISDAVELTEINIESIKAELEDNERIALDFPDAVGVGSMWRIGEIVTKNGVKIKGFGSGKRLRGVKHGVYRPDLTIIDDLENDSEVRSLEQRDRKEHWLDDAVMNLGAIDGSMDTLYIGTLLHRDGVLARKLNSGFWSAKKYQALIEPPHRLDLWDTYGAIYKSQGKEAAHSYFLNNEAAMRSGVKLLWDAAGLENVMRLKIESPRAFAKEQQNNPLSESSRFTREKIKYWNSLPNDLIHFGWCDPAGSGKKSDFTSFCIIGVSPSAKKGYCIESINKIMPSTEIIKTTFDLQSRYRCRRFGFETNGGQFHLKSWLMSEAFNRGVILPVVGVHNTRPKAERIEELELPIENAELLLHPSQAILIQQLEEFPEGKNDDAPDALHGAYNLSKLSKLKASRGGARRANMRFNPRRRNW